MTTRILSFVFRRPTLIPAPIFQSQSQLSRLSNHAQDESAVSNDNSQNVVTRDYGRFEGKRLLAFVVWGKVRY